jgi:hypothetical protein
LNVFLSIFFFLRALDAWHVIGRTIKIQLSKPTHAQKIAMLNTDVALDDAGRWLRCVMAQGV